MSATIATDIHEVKAPPSARQVAAPTPPRNVAVDAYRGLVMLLMMGEVMSFAKVARAFPIACSGASSPSTRPTLNGQAWDSTTPFSRGLLSWSASRCLTPFTAAQKKGRALAINSRTRSGEASYSSPSVFSCAPQAAHKPTLPLKTLSRRSAWDTHSRSSWRIAAQDGSGPRSAPSSSAIGWRGRFIRLPVRASITPPWAFPRTGTTTSPALPRTGTRTAILARHSTSGSSTCCRGPPGSSTTMADI